MRLKELLGKRIRDIRVKQIQEPYGLDISASYLMLDNECVVDIPWKETDLEDEIEVEEIPTKAESITKLLKNKGRPILNQFITDILYFEEDIQFEKAFIELANGYLISEITIAPHGTGAAGLWYFESIQALETKHGKNYTRLTNKKGSAQH